jgi:hypothetical protein
VQVASQVFDRDLKNGYASFGAAEVQTLRGGSNFLCVDILAREVQSGRGPPKRWQKDCLISHVKNAKEQKCLMMQR